MPKDDEGNVSEPRPNVKGMSGYESNVEAKRAMEEDKDAQEKIEAAKKARQRAGLPTADDKNEAGTADEIVENVKQPDQTVEGDKQKGTGPDKPR